MKYSYSRAAKEYQSRGYRDKDRDRGGKSGRDDRYNNSRSRYHDKHSNSIPRSRWPNDSYPSTSSSHYKRDGENIFIFIFVE
jgi:hypothetical protein